MFRLCPEEIHDFISLGFTMPALVYSETAGHRTPSDYDDLREFGAPHIRGWPGVDHIAKTLSPYLIGLVVGLGLSLATHRAFGLILQLSRSKGLSVALSYP